MGHVFRIGSGPLDGVEREVLAKPIVERVYIDSQGLGGDYNHRRTVSHNGTPDRAVSIMTTDVLEDFCRNGWKLSPGDMGENLSISGIPYDGFSVGTRFSVGENSFLQITQPITPCKKLALIPGIGEGRVAEFMKLIVGKRGWYAQVLAPGEITLGDSVIRL